MFLEEIAPDVIVEVSGRRIKAHKCILSSRYSTISIGKEIDSTYGVDNIDNIFIIFKVPVLRRNIKWRLGGKRWKCDSVATVSKISDSYSIYVIKSFRKIYILFQIFL